MKLAIIDYKTSETIINSLGKFGINCIKTVKNEKLYQAIDGHPDISIHFIDDKTAVCTPESYNYFQQNLSNYGINVIKGNSILKKYYPYNIAYNALRVGKFIFHHLKYTDINILSEYEKMDVKLINVAQGYTKCSVCVLNENALITADTALEKTFEKQGIETLLIEQGNIHLPGFEYGFIGGATGVLDQALYVTGSLKFHKNYIQIIDFVNKYNMKIQELSYQPPVDVGSILFINIDKE